MFFSKAFVISLSAITVLATPHALNHALHHRAIAARVAQPPQPSQNATLAIRNRRNTQRCKQRPVSSSSLSSSSPTSTPTTTTQQQVPPIIDPTPSPSPSPTPSPTPVQQQPAPAPTTSQAPSGGDGNGLSWLHGTQTGQGTYYATGLGACGITNTDTDYIAAVSHLMFDTYPGYNHVNPNSNPICNKKIQATYQGKTVTVTITDRCTGCAITDLDFSPTGFNTLADFAVGRISGMTWVWV